MDNGHEYAVYEDSGAGNKDSIIFYLGQRAFEIPGWDPIGRYKKCPGEIETPGSPEKEMSLNAATFFFAKYEFLERHIEGSQIKLRRRTMTSLAFARF